MDRVTVDREIFIGLVSPVGTNLGRIIEILTEVLADYDYETVSLRLADLLKQVPAAGPLTLSPADAYIESHMDAGDNLRKLAKRDDALPVLAFRIIAQKRAEAPRERRAFIFRSLKHPSEIATLRDVYGDSFYVIAISASHEMRRQMLASRIAATTGESPTDRFLGKAEDLIWRDQSGSNNPDGQQVSDAFHRADFFVDGTDDARTKEALERIVALIFGDTLITPNRFEYGMFMAKAAALRSSELGRQVGACIASPAGEVISLGTNEVPKALGGLYWCDDSPDERQFQRGSDSNDDNKRTLVLDTLKRLKTAGWLSEQVQAESLEQLTDKALHRTSGVFNKESRIQNLIEFGRAVHGEMAALMDAARRGVSVSGSNMFVTTFPCHLCARHIVAAGIKTVYYIEPYAKSLTAELYPDSISVEREAASPSVAFMPFVGVSPRQYLRMFEASNRKNSTTGKVIRLEKRNAKPRFAGAQAFYPEKEDFLLKSLIEALKLHDGEQTQ